MDNIVEHYKGYIGISGAWLIDLLGKVDYDNYNRRGTIRSLRRGGNGRTALVDWQSMGTRMKAKVVAALGYNPAKAGMKSLLRQVLEARDRDLLDGDAWEYFRGLKSADGSYLPEEKVTRMWNGAKIMAAIGEVLQRKKMAGEGGYVRYSEKRTFEALSREVVGELAAEWPNTLPGSADRLRKKWHEWMLHGNEVLVHGLTGKEGNRKGLDEEAEAVVAALTANGRKLNDAQVSKVAGAIGIEVDRRRVQEIRKCNEVATMARREGERRFDAGVAMQVDRVRPDMPLKMVSIDGWDAELYYRDDKSHYNRLTVEVILDVMTDYPLGYAIGDKETGALIREALMDAVQETRRLLGGYYGLWQLQSDNYARKMMAPYYRAVAKYYTPAKVGNAKSKPVEPYFRSLESEYLFAYVNNSGHNITAKTNCNDEWLSERRYDFPDREGCVAQIAKIMEIERGRKAEAMRAAWAAGAEEMKRPLDMEQYLMVFGEVGRGNMLTPNGLKVVREGKEYKFDCFDADMREHRGERWVLRYDLGDMSRALAVSEDGRWRCMVSAKAKVPMAIVDYKEEDWRALAEYRDYNRTLRARVTDKMCAIQGKAEAYVTKRQLSGELAGKLLTESGAHKDFKAQERRRLAASAEDTPWEEVPAAVQEKRDKDSREKRESVWDRV